MAFEQLKEALIIAPIIKPPKWDQPFEVIGETDDSVVSVVLAQHEGNKLNVIYYTSHTLNDAQRNCAKDDREFYVVMFACEKFRSYITDTKVRVYTDHQAIKDVLTKKDFKPRWIRWALLLQEFDMKILNRSEIDDMKMDVSLTTPDEVNNQESKVCIPYGTTVSLDGITTRTFGNADPLAIYACTSPSKIEVRKVRDFDINNYPNGLCPSKLAWTNSSMNPSKREKKVGTKVFLKNKSWEKRKSNPCHLYGFS